MPRTIRNLGIWSAKREDAGKIYTRQDLQQRVEVIAQQHDISVSAVAALAIESGLKVERRLARHHHQQDG